MHIEGRDAGKDGRASRTGTLGHRSITSFHWKTSLLGYRQKILRGGERGKDKIPSLKVGTDCK
jgi:hypothetical protein